jgi:O-antigen/teichoic acid export membrane protein
MQLIDLTVCSSRIVRTMRARLKSLWAGRFGRNVIWMGGATGVGQLVFLLATPVLMRLYTPEAFAQVGILMTLQALLLAGMTGRIERSAPTAGKESRVVALVAAALIVLVTSIIGLITAVLFGFERILLELNIASDSGLLLFAFPLSVFTAGLQMVLHSWCVTTGHLRPVAFSKLLQSVAFVAVALLAGVTSGAALWLSAGFMISNVLAGSVLLALLGDLNRRFMRLRRRYIWAVVARSSNEIAASLGSSLLHSLAFYLPFLMIWTWYDDTVLGWFALVFRVGMAPISFLTAALAKSFWAEAADLAKRDPIRLRKFFVRTVVALGFAGIPFLAACLMAPVFFGSFFGKEWEGAGNVLAALSPMLVALLVFSSTNHLIVYKRQHWQMYCDALSVVLFAGVFWVFAAEGYEVGLTLGLSSLAFLLSYGIRFGLHLLANHLWTKEQQI